jgi:HEAT repeat protein
MKGGFFKWSVVAAVVAASALAVGTDAESATAAGEGGVQAVYGAQGGDNSEEFLSTNAAIGSTAISGAPTAIWQTLEHGEEVECLDCIGVVAPLLYDPNAKNREIAAWWLRRRVFGVFGPGEVYQQTLTTLTTASDPTTRAYAASALGEFLVGSGIAPLAQALVSDPDPGVRAAAASALGRLNDAGSSAFTQALGDSDDSVKIATIEAAGRLSALPDPNFPPTLAGLLGSPTARVRMHAVQLLDEMNASSNVAAVMALAKGDSDATVRLAACHALGTFGAPSAQATLQAIAASDASGLVRDMATIALRRL